MPPDAEHQFGKGSLVFQEELGSGRIIEADTKTTKVNFFGKSAPEDVTIDDWCVEQVSTADLKPGGRRNYSRMLPLNVLPPEEAIPEDRFAEYDQRRKTVWRQIVWIEKGLYTCRTLAEFPFEIFSIRNDIGFFQTAFRYIEEGVLIRMMRLFDTGEGEQQYRGLRRFRNFVVQSADPRCRPEICWQLRQNPIDTKLERRARDYRNQAVAHLDDEVAANQQLRARLHVDWTELQELHDQCVDFFKILCMGFGLLHETHNYSSGNSELEDLLDLVAENSRLFKHARKDSPYWRRQKKKLSDEQLATVESYLERLAT